jgi:hypothetical protein
MKKVRMKLRMQKEHVAFYEAVAKAADVKLYQVVNVVLAMEAIKRELAEANP